MTRTGKISRLPRHIRDQLCRRLDDGEPGVALVEWLNSLPDVQLVLKTHFQSHAITEKNLSDWKANGYLDWQGQQQSLAVAREVKAKAVELTTESDGDLTKSLVTIVAACYAAALDGCNGEITDEMRHKLRGMKGISREVLRLERMNIQREWLDLGQRRYQDSKNSTGEKAMQFCLDETDDYPEAKEAFTQAFAVFFKARKEKLECHDSH